MALAKGLRETINFEFPLQRFVWGTQIKANFKVLINVAKWKERLVWETE